MNLDFASYIDEIEFEPFLGDDEEAYQSDFDKWYYVMGVHEFEGKKVQILEPRADLRDVALDTSVIIRWIKEVAPEANPKILRTNLSRKDYNKKLPVMCF